MTLSDRARAWRAQRRRAILLEAGAVAAAGSAAALGAVALADRFAGLPQGLRAAALAAWAAWLARELWRRGVRPWREAGWDQVFDAAARAWPETRALLASAWSLRAGALSSGTSEELRAEHLARADRLAAGLPDRPLFVWAPSRAARALAAAAAAVLAANAAWGDRASWARALAPWRDPALERWVEVAPGDARLDWGAPAEVRARPSAEGAERGVRAAELSLESRGGDGTWRALPWSRVAGGEAAWASAGLTAPLDYRVRWRGLVGRPLRLEPVPPPRWASATAVVRGTRGEKRFALGADAAVAARRGDWIGVEAASEGPLSSAALRLSDEPTPQAMRFEGGLWRGGFLARRDASLTFALVSADGRRDPSPPVYAVRVAADEPPTVELLSPQAPLVASPRDSVPVAYAARDDGAVARLALVVRVAGRPDEVRPIAAPSPPQAEVLGDYALALDGLAPGTRAEFWVEAWDDASPPQLGRSASGTVEIVDADAAHRDALAARAAADAALERAAALAEAARDASHAGDLAASRADTERLRAAWEEARARAAEWARRAASDPRGDPGLAEEAASAAEELARAGAEGLPEAARALARADARGAEREQAALAEEARGVQRALRAGAESQSAQDVADRAHDAGSEAERVARDSERLAARGKDGSVSPAELENLRRAAAELEKALEDLRRAAQELAARSPGSTPESAESMDMAQARADAAEISRALAAGDVAGAARAARRLADRMRRLSEQLDQVGRLAAAARAQRGAETASRVRRAWDEAARAQEAAVEAARPVDGARRGRLLVAQKELLARLDAEIAGARAALAPAPPGPSPLRGAQIQADEGLRRLRAGDAVGAALFLRDAASRLRSPAAGRDADGARARAAAALSAAADALQSGPPAPAPDPAGARPAAEAESRARLSADRLRAAVSDAARGFGFLSGRLARRVDAAREEEGAAETALRGGDGGEGLSRAEAALAILEEGSRDAESAESAAAASAAASARPSGGGGGVRAVAGSRLERVRLPSALDYRPPSDLREELRRSLSEPRPSAADSEVKQYLERLAR
jgi:hypothetical protein